MSCLNIKEGCNTHFYSDALFNLVPPKGTAATELLFELLWGEINLGGLLSGEWQKAANLICLNKNRWALGFFFWKSQANTPRGGGGWAGRRQ